MGTSPEKPTEENADDSPEFKNQLMDNFGLRKNKKSLIRFDLDNFDEMPENIDLSAGVLYKLQKKAKKYNDYGNNAAENVSNYFFVLLNK